MDNSYEIRKKKVFDLICSDIYTPMKIKELAIVMQVSKEDRPQLEQILLELQAEGKIALSKRGKYTRTEETLVTGTFQAHPKGFGFVSVDGMKEDIFIPAEKVHGAMQKDTVSVSVSPLETGRRKEGTIVKILERGMKQVICTYQECKNFGFAIPDDKKFGKDIFIAPENARGTVTGHKVVVEILDYGNSGKYNAAEGAMHAAEGVMHSAEGSMHAAEGSMHSAEERGRRTFSGSERKRDSKNPEGKIVEILGHINDPGVDILSIVRAYELPVDFSEKIMNQVERVAKPVSEADMAGRLDLREEMVITIDGEDSKDLDDAISLRMEGENYILGVHIADVTNYVQEHSAIDEEALKRGTSVYLADRVIPMLPHALSNGICSLNEGEDRLTLSCIMTISPSGEIVDHQITESVINSNHRMTYTVVNQLITEEERSEGTTSSENTTSSESTTSSENATLSETTTSSENTTSSESTTLSESTTSSENVICESAKSDPIKSDPYEKYADVIPMLRQMAVLSRILRARRAKRGAIDFDFPETKVLLDPSGKPLEIKPYERNAATKLIEDFMLAANETIAEDFFWQEIPFVYRNHEKPDSDKIRSLSAFINNFGYTMRIGNDEIHPKELQKLLDKIEGTDEEALLSRLVLRSMKQARYTSECTGHFGLAAKYYCHFTSPIRRYPDLQIHRIIKDALRGRMNDAKMQHYQEILPEVAKHSSETERRADEAERETIKLKKTEYMSEHIGEVYEGVISGVTEWGFFVELTNTVEGLVRAAELMDDYYEYFADSYELVGRTRGKRYKLGQRVMVRVAGCDTISRTVDFELA